jgi:plasmid stabilization system protein ParE
MELQYLETSQLGLKWMRSYYRQNPQLDRQKALSAVKYAERRLMDFPYSGEQYEDFSTVRELHIPGTAFSMLYTIARDVILIIDIRDTRGQRSAEALRYYINQLKAKYNIK